MSRLGRLELSAAALGLVAASVVGCGSFSNGTSPTCKSQLSQVSMTAKAGTLHSDGSVTVFGTVQFGNLDGGAELTVRQVYVAGQAAIPGANDFNFRSWSVTVPPDVLAAYATGTGRAALPVVAYLYGGCIANLPVAAEPVVTVKSLDGGIDARTDAASPSDAKKDAPSSKDSLLRDSSAD